MVNSTAAQWHTLIITFLTSFLGKNASNDIATTFLKWVSTERQRVWACILDYQTAMQRSWPIIVLSAAFMGQKANDDMATVTSLYALGFNFTNMHPMSHRSDFFLACSSKVYIWELAIYLSITYPLTVIRIELRRVQFPTVMSDTKSLNTSLLELMISSKDKCVFIRDLSDLTLQITFDAWWASINVGSKRPIAWNNSRHAPSLRFYLHCAIEETGSPGIICIVCHQVLRHPSEHGTSSMGKHLLAEVHIAKISELTVSEVTELASSTVNETVFAILKWQGIEVFRLYVCKGKPNLPFRF